MCGGSILNTCFVGSFKEIVVKLLPLLVPFTCFVRPLGFKFRGSSLRRRTGFTMAELISFVVPTQSDKVLLVWDLSTGPPAEALSVRGCAERAGEGGGGTGGVGPRGRRGTGSQRGLVSLDEAPR